MPDESNNNHNDAVIMSNAKSHNEITKTSSGAYTAVKITTWNLGSSLVYKMTYKDSKNPTIAHTCLIKSWRNYNAIRKI